MVAEAQQVIEVGPKRLSRAQHRVLTSQATYVGFLGGRGSGKTHVGALWAAMRLTEPGRSQPPVMMVASPTYHNLRTGAQAQLVPLLTRIGLLRRGGHKQQLGELQLTNGATVYLRSLDRHDVISRGPNLSDLWLDEAALLRTSDAWNSLTLALRQPGCKVQALVTTTPKKHWLFEEFGKHPDGRYLRADTEAVHSSLRDNPALTAEHIERSYARFDGAYLEQELEGQWVDFEAVLIYDCAAAKIQPAPVGKLKKTCRGWDLASQADQGDYTCGVLLSVGEDNRVYIRDCVRGQWAAYERDQMILSAAKSDDGGGERVTQSLPKEKSGSGNSQAQYHVRLLVGHSVVTHSETGDKVTRAHPAAAQMAAGNITLTCEPGRWANYWHQDTKSSNPRRLSPDDARAQFLDNLARFPAYKTKDESDAMAAALAEASQSQSWFIR